MTNNQARDQVSYAQDALTESNSNITALQTHSGILQSSRDNFDASIPENDEEAEPGVYEGAVRLREQAEAFFARIPTPEA